MAGFCCSLCVTLDKPPFPYLQSETERTSLLILQGGCRNPVAPKPRKYTLENKGLIQMYGHAVAILSAREFQNGYFLR